jgi:hypothetical protein
MILLDNRLLFRNKKKGTSVHKTEEPFLQKKEANLSKLYTVRF